MSQHNEAMRRVSLSRAVVANKVTYWAKWTQGLRPVISEGLGTVAVTKDLVMLVDPKVVGSEWTAEQVHGAFAHEVCHPALGHHDRAEKMREGLGATFDALLWNKCADFECNRLVRALGLPLPEGALFAEDHDLPANVLAEVAYRTLSERGEKGDDGDEGNDDGEDQSGDNPGEGKQGDKKGKGKGKIGAGRCGSCAGGEPLPEEANVPEDAKASALERGAIEQAVAEAIVAEAAKGRGSIPADVLRRAKERLAPSPTPWQKILAKHVRRAVDRRRGFRDYTFSRPSRRQSMHGYGPNAPIIPAPFEPVVDVAVVVDTSGSMGGDEMRAALAEIDALLRTGRNEVRVLSCDAKVHAKGKVTRAVDAAKLLKGGGGTDFCPAFAALEADKPGVTIVVTDGCGPAPEDAPRWTDTIWLLVGSYRSRPWGTRTGREVKWGEFIEVK